ncbi:MAG: hypothetical protein RLP09_30625 [Sandaracinaceae bacterium]
MRDALLAKLSSDRAVRTDELLEATPLARSAENVAVVEALLLLSPEAERRETGWALAGRRREDRLLRAIREYADGSGKRIFRLSAALEGFPTHELPTADELSDLLPGDEFKLLPNGMIKRVKN